MDLWNNTEKLIEFIEENENDIPQYEDINELPFKIINDANSIDEKLHEIAKNDSLNLNLFFAPLHNQEYHEIELSKQKGRESYLRLYALKIDDNCYVVTGGAIKFHHLMEDRQHTKKELAKLERCRSHLKENNVFDIDSFLEFINE